jgi:hypothetical protein
VTADSPVRAPVPAQRRIRPLRLALTVIAGVIVLLCMGGVGIGVTLYDEATTLQHDDPEIVVSNYLRAVFDGDDVNANALECDDDSGLAPFRAFQADVLEREQRFGVDIDVTWGPLTVIPEGDQRIVSTEITRFIINAESSVQPWSFTVVEQGGWKVCGARRTS